jgi:hypothetical protein
MYTNSSTSSSTFVRPLNYNDCLDCAHTPHTDVEYEQYYPDPFTRVTHRKTKHRFPVTLLPDWNSVPNPMYNTLCQPVHQPAFVHTVVPTVHTVVPSVAQCMSYTTHVPTFSSCMSTFSSCMPTFSSCLSVQSYGGQCM